jgi:hypothetical protein
MRRLRPAGASVLESASRPLQEALMADFLVVPRQELLRRICGEYLEMPGLLLTPAQAQRLWALDAVTCAQALDYLVDAGFLVRQRDGKYGRAADGVVSPPVQMARASLASSRRGRLLA